MVFFEKVWGWAREGTFLKSSITYLYIFIVCSGFRRLRTATMKLRLLNLLEAIRVSRFTRSDGNSVLRPSDLFEEKIDQNLFKQLRFTR